MKKPGQKTYKGFRSFVGKSRVAFYLSAVLPYLIVVYLFVDKKIGISEIVLLFGALALFSMLTGFVLIRNSGDQLVLLVKETGRMKTGEKNDFIRFNADQELNDIAENFNVIVEKMHVTEKGMREQSMQLMTYARDVSRSYKQTKEEERLRSKLSRYVGQNLIDKLIQSKDKVFPESESKEVTILFADIRSFTTLAEKMADEEVVSMLNEYFDEMVDIVFKHNGILDKFVGDQLIAVFGVISPEDKGPDEALNAAIEMQAAAKGLMNQRSAQGKETFEIGIGINTGRAIVGNVGSKNRLDYTVIGDTVNTAARLQQEARGGEIIIGEQTFRKAQGPFQIGKKGEIQVKNKIKPVTCYQVNPINLSIGS